MLSYMCELRPFRQYTLSSRQYQILLLTKQFSLALFWIRGNQGNIRNDFSKNILAQGGGVGGGGVMFSG